jgi:hypothetical protein
MNSTHEGSATQSDDTQGHRLAANVNETADTDDDTEGHSVQQNVNETADTDDDR